MKDVIKINVELLRYNKKIIIANFFLWLVINCLPLIISVWIQNIFDCLEIYNSGMHSVWCGLLVGGVLAQSYCIVLGGKVDTITRFDIRSRLRGNLIYKSITDRRHVKSDGTILEILSTDIAAFEELISVEIDLICKLVFAVIAIILLLRIDKEIMILTIIPMLSISNIIYKLSERIKARHNESRDSNIQYTELVENIISNHEVIQMVAQEAFVFGKIEKILEQRKKATIKSDVFNLTINELTEIGNILSTVIILLYIAIKTFSVNLSVGQLTLIISLSSYIGSYNGLFTETLCSFQFADNTINRIYDIFSGNKYNIVCDEKKELDLLKKEFEFEEAMNVNINLGKGKIAFDIKPDEMVAVCGKTGSGKTHLIDALIGYAKYDGEITIDGRKVEYLNDVGVSLQSPVFINETIKENLVFGDVCSIEDALKTVNLKDELSTEISCIDKIGVDGRKLSEGQRQRLSIARAILVGGRFLILDDSTALLDYKNEKEIIEKLRDKHYTILIASNRPSVLKMADKCVVMKDEKVVQIGTYEGLKSYL